MRSLGPGHGHVYSFRPMYSPLGPSSLLPPCPLLPSFQPWTSHLMPGPLSGGALGPRPGPWERVIFPGLLFLSHTASLNKWPQHTHLLIVACLFAFELSEYRGEGFILPNKIKDGIIYPILTSDQSSEMWFWLL